MFLIVLSHQANAAILPWRRARSPPCIVTSRGCFLTSTLSLAVALLVCVQEVPVSNLGRDTEYPDSVGCKVLTAVVMKSCTFRDITRYSPMKANRRLGGTSPSSSASTQETSMKLVDFQRTTQHYIANAVLILRLVVAFLSLSKEIPG
jgi:hypothetical protein